MLAQGTFKAKIRDYGVKESKAGLPYVVVAFGVGEETVYWSGYFSDKTIEGTKATLTLLGLKGGNLPALALGLSSNSLDTTKEFVLVVVHEPDNEGKMWARVRFVNDPNASNVRGTVDFDRARQLFAGISFGETGEENLPF